MIVKLVDNNVEEIAGVKIKFDETYDVICETRDEKKNK